MQEGSPSTARNPPTTGRRGSRSSVATTIVDNRIQTKKSVAIPIKYVVVVSLCLFTVSPAIVLWLLSWKSSKDGIDSLQSLSEQSVAEITYQLRLTLLANATNAFLNIITPTETALLFQAAAFRRDGVPSVPTSTITSDFLTFFQSNMTYAFYVIKSLPLVSSTAFSMYSRYPYSYPAHQKQSLQQGYLFTRLSVDVIRNAEVPTIYATSQLANSYMNDSTLSYIYIDQTNGKILFSFYSLSYKSLTLKAVDPTQDEFFNWYGKISFNTNTGSTELMLQYLMPLNDGDGLIAILVYTTVQTISKFFYSLISDQPKWRLFLFFRNPDGVLIGASHGKYFSHSDIDYSKNNPLLNPPPVSEFTTYTPMDSNDPIIFSAASFLYSLYSGWDSIPEVNLEARLLGENFWISTTYITSQINLQVEMCLVIDVSSKLGTIQENQAKTNRQIQDTNNKLTIILCVVVGAAFIFAIILSLILTQSLSKLSFGMDALAMLNFSEEDVLIKNESRFTEVSKCQRSFWALERGLRAFVKYVPRGVVKMMLSGEMESTTTMTRKPVSVLFMDIAGFSTLCEKISAEELVEMASEYLQGMCEIIVRSGGTLDKFIGDCIEAMWNAPRPRKFHESAAVGAALDMQRKLVKLWEGWKDKNLPLFKFRVGINSDAVLVGNFGCEYRISYTCLGEGVNVASQLEAANKVFGSVVMVAGTTSGNARDSCYFRKLGHVLVPGKADWIEVYEPLFRIRSPAAEAELGDEMGRKNSSYIHVKGHSAAAERDTQTPPDGKRNADESEVLNAWALVSKELLRRTKELYERGLEAFLRGAISEAEKFFLQALDGNPADGPSKCMLKECQDAKHTSDKSAWTGVINLGGGH